VFKVQTFVEPISKTETPTTTDEWLG